MRWLAVALLVTLFVWGCSQKAPETAERSATPAAEPPAAEPPATEAPAAEAGSVAMEAASTHLTGTLGCGHCTFHTTESCAIAMKTEDGRIVVIDAESLANEDHLFAERMSGKPVSVDGTLEEVEGQLVIHSKTVEIQ